MPPAKKPSAARSGAAATKSGATKTRKTVKRQKQKDMPRRLVSRPQYRRIFVDRGPAWLVLEPHRLGLIAAAAFTFLTVLAYFLASLRGVIYAPTQVLIGAMSTFVISYAAVGIFVWYVLLVTDREFGPEVAPEKKKMSLLGAEKKAAAMEAAQPVEVPQEPPQVNQPEE